MPSWNNAPQGVSPTDNQVNFSGGLHPDPRLGFENQTATAAMDAIAAIGQILKQRQQDKIANQLLAVDNAPKAVAVDGTQPGTGMPDTQLTQAMMQRNLGQGLPVQDSGQVPDRGGWEGLQTSDFMHERMAKQLKEQQAAEDRPLDLAIKRATIEQKLRTPGLTPDFQYKLMHPDAITPAENRLEQDQTRADLDRQIAALNEAGGLKMKDKAGEVSPRITPLTLGSAADVHTGTGPGGEYIPEGYYGIGGKQLETVVPSGPFDAAHKAYNAYQSRVGGQSQSTPEGGKSLDTATAQQFLQQAGGNKDKARELARAAGYSF